MFNTCLSALFVIVDSLWIYGAVAVRFINSLHVAMRPHVDHMPDERLWRDVVHDQPRRLPPSAFMTIVVPVVLLIGWGLLFVQSLYVGDGSRGDR